MGTRRRETYHMFPPFAKQHGFLSTTGASIMELGCVFFAAQHFSEGAALENTRSNSDFCSNGVISCQSFHLACLMVLALPAPWSLLLLLLFGDVETSRLCTRRNVFIFEVLIMLQA